MKPRGNNARLAAREARLRRIFDRTEGRCHICRKRLAFGNYGARGRRGAWEVEHSRPQSRGGTDHGNNLYAAHIHCNRAKGNRSTRTARRRHGFRSAPPSVAARRRHGRLGAAVGMAIGLAAPPPARVAATLLLAVGGYVVGYRREPS